MSNVQAHHGYNLSGIMVDTYVKYFDHRDAKLHELINGLQQSNLEMKLINDLMNKLAHGKQKDKQVDFNNDQLARKLAYLAHLNNRTVFEDKIQGVPDNGETLKGKLKEIIADLKTSGVPEYEIDHHAILDRVQVPHTMKISTLSEADIDIVIQGLDGTAKEVNADLNKSLMDINRDYDDIAQMTEQARKVVDESNQHVKSIINRTAGRGP